MHNRITELPAKIGNRKMKTKLTTSNMCSTCDYQNRKYIKPKLQIVSKN